MLLDTRRLLFGQGRNLQYGLDNGFDGDAGHAAEINGAGAEETRGARRVRLEENIAFIAWQTGAGQVRGSAAEGDHYGSPEGGGDVHRAGVVREEHAPKFQQGHELAKRGF